jgi:hypothetical protein
VVNFNSSLCCPQQHPLHWYLLKGSGVELRGCQEMIAKHMCFCLSGFEHRSSSPHPVTLLTAFRGYTKRRKVILGYYQLIWTRRVNFSYSYVVVASHLLILIPTCTQCKCMSQRTGDLRFWGNIYSHFCLFTTAILITQLGWSRNRWKDNNKIDLEEIGREDLDWIQLPQHRVRAVMILPIP